MRFLHVFIVFPWFSGVFPLIFRRFLSVSSSFLHDVGQEPSIRAFVKGLSEDACELFLPHVAGRLGGERAAQVVAPELLRMRHARQSVQRHHEMARPSVDMKKQARNHEKP